jgi:large subunit ribosomal protein L25
MKTQFELIAEFRDDQGKGASRRLRRAGRTPAILYGGRREPRALTVDMAKLQQALDDEKFYSSIVTLKVGEQTQAAVLRDLQRHPWKATIVHVDFQRVLEDEPIRMLVPLHFLNQETAPGVKTEGGMVSHLRNELLIECLPKDLPEHIEVDLTALNIGDSTTVADITAPAGVTLLDDPETVIASVQAPAVEEEVVAEAGEMAEVPEVGKETEATEE